MSIYKFLATNTLTSWFFDLGYRFFYRFRFEKNLIPILKRKVIEENFNQKFQYIFKGKEVLNGPFKGLKYPDFFSHGSSLYAKLLGSYEDELHYIINSLKDKKIDIIIDVGCAEGFYANGFGKLFPNSKVLAYDVEPSARQSCLKMAQANNLKNVEVGEFYSNSDIEKLRDDLVYLFVVDCEGYEIDLFNENNLKKLKNSYLIIELHDLKNERISPYLKKLFQTSHNQLLIYSRNPLEKLESYQIDSNLSTDELLFAFSERSGIMQWLYLEPKSIN